MSRKEKSRLTRRRIYDATYHLVREKGLDYTVTDVCRRSGVSVGSFYHFYKSKEAVAQDIYIFFDEHMEGFLQSLTGSCEEKIENALCEAVSYSSSLGVQFLQLSINSIASHDGAVVHVESPLFAFLCRTIRESGYSLEEKPDYYARFLITLFRGTLNWWTVNGGVFDIEKRMRSYVRTALRGMFN